MLPFAFDPGMGFQAYVDWVLDAPMYFVYREGRYLDALGQSFRDFLKGQLPALPGEKPTLSDWADHMTTVFPEARAKKFIEMRGADCGDRAHIAALPAFWVGLMYDQTALDAAWDLVKGLDAETREALRVAASVSALVALILAVPQLAAVFRISPPDPALMAVALGVALACGGWPALLTRVRRALSR